MQKNHADCPRTAHRRALIASCGAATALAATAVKVGGNPRRKPQLRRRGLLCDAALRADSFDDLALKVWDDDGGHSGTSEPDERYTGWGHR